MDKVEVMYYRLTIGEYLKQFPDSAKIGRVIPGIVGDSDRLSPDITVEEFLRRFPRRCSWMLHARHLEPPQHPPGITPEEAAQWGAMQKSCEYRVPAIGVGGEERCRARSLGLCMIDVCPKAKHLRAYQTNGD